VTEIVHQGRLVAALVHDPLLLENPGLLHAVAGAAALSLENQRLNAELLARLAELRARARIVQAGDSERRRLERNLHDGAQSRFVALARDLRLARAHVNEDPEVADVPGRAIENIAHGLEELRELARGIHPAILTDKCPTRAARARRPRACRRRGVEGRRSIVGSVDAVADLERGRESYAASAWREAFESLSRADQAAPLGAEDLELLARAAYMVGRDDEYLGGLERAHHARAGAGEVARAARCAC
jgi:signal transduction histidine kinase